MQNQPQAGQPTPSTGSASTSSRCLSLCSCFTVPRAGDCLSRQLTQSLPNDAATHYMFVQPIMEAITAAGIARINLMAFLKEEGPENLKVD